MAEDILSVYHRILESLAVPFEEVVSPNDWHLTLFAVPSFQPEEIFNIDHRGDRTLFHRARLLPSLWSAVLKGKGTPGQVAPVSVERTCIELPLGHGLVQLVGEEQVFRMQELKTSGLDGTAFTLVHAYRGGTRRISAWEPMRDPSWARLWNEIQAATTLLPRRA